MSEVGFELRQTGFRAHALNCYMSGSPIWVSIRITQGSLSRVLGPSPRGLGWGLRFFIPKKIPGDPQAAGPKTTLATASQIDTEQLFRAQQVQHLFPNMATKCLGAGVGVCMCVFVCVCVCV